MAKDKKSFVLYTNYLEVFEELSDTNAGKLAKHLFRYVNDLDLKPQNPIVRLAFIQIKQQLKRDLKKWENEKELKSDAGIIGNLKRWNPDLYDTYLKDKSKLNELLNIAKDRKGSQSDKKIAVNVNDTVNVNDNVISKGFKLFWDKYHLITKLNKTDKDSAEKYWKKLTNKEKQSALDNIEFYYNSLNNKKYCKKARTYLSDKNFNDEFKNSNNNIIIDLNAK